MKYIEAITSSRQSERWVVQRRYGIVTVEYKSL